MTAGMNGGQGVPKQKRPNRSDPAIAPEAEPAGAEQQARQQPAGPAPAEPPKESKDAPSTAEPNEAHEVIFGEDVAEEKQPDELEQLRTELKEAKDRALRSQAELENYRKRVARQMAEERRYANLPLMRDLLPVLDNMQRAIAAAEKTHDTAGLLEGVKMVAQQLEDVLGRHACVRIGALNKPFDPHRHEAVSQQASEEHPNNTVLLVTQTGFQLHDRVVRPSQVIVSTEVCE